MWDATIEVAIDCIVGQQLEHVLSALAAHKMRLVTKVGLHTHVLLVGNAAVYSEQYWLAQARQIPCTGVSWIDSGGCLMENLKMYEVHMPCLFRSGIDVCSSGLSDGDRELLRKCCYRHGSVTRLRSALTKMCRLLVTPSPTFSGSSKLSFAASHGIPTASLSQVLAQCHCITNSSCVNIGPSSESNCTWGQTSEWVTCAKPSGINLMTDIVVYCTPASCANAQLLQLLQQLSICRVCDLVDEVTHVVVMTSTLNECIFPRPGLKFVTVEWLYQCAQTNQRLSCQPFCLPLERRVFRPTITFSCLMADEVQTLREAMGAAGLPFSHEQYLKLAPAIFGANLPDSTSTERKHPRQFTTHLVIPSARWRSSKKLATLSFLASRDTMYCCQAVDIMWVTRSIVTKRWINPDGFAVPLPPPVAFQQRPNVSRFTSSTGTLRLPAKAHRVESSSVLETSDDAVSPTTAAEGGTKATVLHAALDCSTLVESAKPPLNEVMRIGGTAAPTKYVCEHPIRRASAIAVPTPLIRWADGDREEEGESSSQCSSYVFFISKDAERALDEWSVMEQVFPHCRRASSVESCTHLITATLTKSEQVLCCMAAGRYILTTQFISDSLRCGSPMSELNYEWSEQQGAVAPLRF